MYWKIELRACSWVAKRPPAQPLLLQRGEERFLGGVVVRAALAAVGLRDPVRAARGAERDRRVLTAAVGVVDDPLAGPTLSDSHLERSGDQRRVGDRAHRPAHDPPREAVQHAGEVQHALAGRDLLHVRAPQLVRAVGLEVALDEIRPDLHPVDAKCAVGVAAALGGHVRALDALHAHQPLDPLVVDLTAPTPQLGVHATGPVGPVALRVHTTDLLDQRRVGECPLGRRTPRPGVVARTRHAQHPAHHRDVEVALLRVDEPEHRYRTSLPSLAKKAAALFRISRSCSRTRTRRRSCVSSSFSSEVRPSRRP